MCGDYIRSWWLDLHSLVLNSWGEKTWIWIRWVGRCIQLHRNTSQVIGVRRRVTLLPFYMQTGETTDVYIISVWWSEFEIGKYRNFKYSFWIRWISCHAPCGCIIFVNILLASLVQCALFDVFFWHWISLFAFHIDWNVIHMKQM